MDRSHGAAAWPQSLHRGSVGVNTIAPVTPDPVLAAWRKSANESGSNCFVLKC
jgi:hypothetical protein